MTAGKANGFGQVLFDPNGSGCTEIPYNFHPMYSTSTPQTRVTWAAGGYNVAMDTEIGHFQYCHGSTPIPATQFGLDSAGNPIDCPAGDFESADNTRPSDPFSTGGDDGFCFPGSEGLLVHVNGCSYTNTGFDGVSYTPVWPDGNSLHPTSFLFSSPETGPHYNIQYKNAAFETDLPDIEFANGACNRTTGAGCSHIPITDSGTPAAFYPFYTTSSTSTGCMWSIGNDGIPNMISDYGRNNQYGPLLSENYYDRGRWERCSLQRFREHPPPQPLSATEVVAV